MIVAASLIRIMQVINESDDEGFHQSYPALIATINITLIAECCDIFNGL